MCPHLIAALHSCQNSTALREVQADVLLWALPVIYIMLIGCRRRRIPCYLMLPAQALSSQSASQMHTACLLS